MPLTPSWSHKLIGFKIYFYRFWIYRRSLNGHGHCSIQPPTSRITYIYPASGSAATGCCSWSIESTSTEYSVQTNVILNFMAIFRLHFVINTSRIFLPSAVSLTHSHVHLVVAFSLTRPTAAAATARPDLETEKTSNCDSSWRILPKRLHHNIVVC